MSESLATAIQPHLQSAALAKLHDDVLSRLDSHHIRYVRIQWVDFNNQVRFRILSVSHFRKLLGLARPGVTLTKATLGIIVLQLAPGTSAVGEYIYVFDLSSFRTCHYAPGHAALFGFFQERVRIPRLSGPSFEVPLCPRTVLSRLVKYAAEELGVQFLIGFEAEFVLLKSTNPVIPVDDPHQHQWTTALPLTMGNIETQVLEEIADAIQEDGIELQMYHAEAAPGQYEVVTGPMTPLEAADALVHVRETIYNIANKHGLRATFAPRLALDNCGSGAHMHVSVHGKRLGTSPVEFLGPLESTFLSGLMHHLPSVIAFTLPLPASYARMVDGIWSGGTWVCWGVDNREAPVRLTNATTPSSRNFEIKSVDGTSSPYLAVTGVLACGIIGIRDELALTVQNCVEPRTAAEMSVEEREALGITKRMPLNGDEARQYLTADKAIKALVGDEFVEHFVKVNRMLGKVFDRREEESEAQALARFVENY